MNARSVSALAVAAWLASPFAAAIAAPVEAPELTLQSVVAAAGERALGVETERLRVQASLADRDAAAGKALPQLSLRNNVNYTQLPGGASAYGAAGPAGLGGLVGFPAAGSTPDPA